MLSALALIPLIASVSAHTIFQELYVNGVSAGHKTGIRLPTSNSPIEDVDSASMACNVNPGTSTDIINIPAGSAATWEFHQGTEKSQYGTGDDPIAASHRGPILVYVAPVSNATTASAEGLKWTKIYEEGFDAATSTFAVDRAIANKGKVDFKVPTCLASGHYLLRAEIIALHSAGQYPGAQFYMSCAQIQITGGGSASLSGVSIPGAYKGSDAGVVFNLYYPAPTSYTIPGPSLFTCDGSGSDPVPEPPVSSTTDEPTSTDVPAPPETTDAPAPPETTDAPAPPETTDAPAPPETTDAPAPPESTTIPTPVETAPGAAQTLYGPCGGINYKGPTSCPAGSICKEYNPWYSQCIAGSAGLQPSGTDASEPVATHYAQCGGASFSGVTKCAAGLTCKVLNPYYSQCL